MYVQNSHQLKTQLPVYNVIQNISTVETSFSHISCRRFDLPHFRARIDIFDKSFIPPATRLWNLLPSQNRNSPSLSQFKRRLSNKYSCSAKYLILLGIGKRYISLLHDLLRMGRIQMHVHL